MTCFLGVPQSAGDFLPKLYFPPFADRFPGEKKNNNISAGDRLPCPPVASVGRSHFPASRRLCSLAVALSKGNTCSRFAGPYGDGFNGKTTRETILGAPYFDMTIPTNPK